MIFLNYRGLDIVGRSAEVIVALTLLPFLALALFAIPHMTPSNWAVASPLAEVNWIDYFNIMFWSLNSWDSVSTLAGEVRDPGKMFPRGLLLGVPLVRPLHHRWSLHTRCRVTLRRRACKRARAATLHRHCYDRSSQPHKRSAPGACTQPSCGCVESNSLLSGRARARRSSSRTWCRSWWAPP